MASSTTPWTIYDSVEAQATWVSSTDGDPQFGRVYTITQDQTTGVQFTDDITTSETMCNYAADQDDWIQVMDGIHLFVDIAGVVANVVALITLLQCKRSLNPTILLLLQHQSFVDAMVCFSDILLNWLPQLWTFGLEALDHLVCHLWHSQFIYWWFVEVSIAALVIVAIDRYLAVCFPFKHKRFTPYYAKLCLTLSYIICFINLVFFALHVSLRNGDCSTEWLFSGKAVNDFAFFYIIYMWLAIYLLPCGVLAGLYCKVIWTLRQRNISQGLGTSRIVDKANSALTKTAICATLVLFFTLSYDINFYTLSFFGIGNYRVSTPQQQIGRLLCSVNSCVNPFIYALFMPAYRRHLMATARCVKYKHHDERRAALALDNVVCRSKSTSTITTISATV